MEKYDVGSATVVKNITKELIRDLAKIDVYLEPNVVSLAVRLLCLDPANGLYLNKTYERRELEEFVSKCVDRLKGRFFRFEKYNLLTAMNTFDRYY